MDIELEVTVLSPVLFSLYTDFIRAAHTDIKMFKYADNMAIVGLLNFNDPDTSYPLLMPYRPL